MALAETLERKATRLHFKPFDGLGVMAVQYYDDANNPARLDPERYGIYVAFEGEEGRLLNDVLHELRRYKRIFGDIDVAADVERMSRDINSQMNMIQRANERITALEKRRWWRWGKR